MKKRILIRIKLSVYLGLSLCFFGSKLHGQGNLSYDLIIKKESSQTNKKLIITSLDSNEVTSQLKTILSKHKIDSIISNYHYTISDHSPIYGGVPKIVSFSYIDSVITTLDVRLSKEEVKTYYLHAKSWKLPQSIKRSKALKYLDLKFLPIENFPESIKKLNQLKYLDLTGCLMFDFENNLDKILELRNLEVLKVKATLIKAKHIRELLKEKPNLEIYYLDYGKGSFTKRF